MKETISCIIIDDDDFALDTLEDFLSVYEGIEVLKKLNDSKIAIKHINNLKPDVVFLDINMPHKTGLDILNEIKALGIESRIVFITSHEDHILHALRNNVADYILKPINIEELHDAIDRIKIEKNNNQNLSKPNQKNENAFQGHSNKKILFRNSHTSVFLDPKDIFYIEADGCYSKIHTRGREIEVISKNIGKLEEMLPENTFFRISRSCIVNIKYISKINRLKRMVSITTEKTKDLNLKAARERLYDLELKLRKFQEYPENRH
jgi:DNA-binding LytR/AlgR family response regulator